MNTSCTCVKLFYFFVSEKWPRTFSGYPSTSGTTGSIGIIKNSKLYIGHVGDSGIALGLDESKCDKFMRLKGSMLTVVRNCLLSYFNS